MAGEFGSTVSRNLVSAMSSRRAPFSEMLPLMRGVSILMRGEAATAASRLTIGAVEFCGLTGAAFGGVVVPACGVAEPGAELGCAVGLASWLCVAVSAFCFSIC